MRDPVMIEADMENNSEKFFEAFREQYPAVADEITKKGWTVIDYSVFEKIKELPEFSDGPSFAKDALVVSSDFNVADRCRKYVLELQDWEDTNGFSTVDLVKECFNVKKAEVDDHGDICIGDERSLAWLDHKGLFKFMVWHMEQVK